MRYDPASDRCRPDRSEDIDRTWQYSIAPAEASSFRDPTIVYPADRMRLALRNKDAAFDESQALELPIRVTVINPQGRTDSLSTFLQGDQFAEVAYPADAYDMWSGVHTVIWTAEDGRFILCAGFRVEELQGE
jgi:hypothetical protein